MTYEELEAIHQRWQMTTPGEWVTGAPDEDSVYAHSVLALTKDYIDPDCELITVLDYDVRNVPADLVFIAAAHQDIPALLEEIKQLRFKLDHANSLINVMCDPAFDATSDKKGL